LPQELEVVHTCPSSQGLPPGSKRHAGEQQSPGMDALGPVALFTIGAVLWRAGQHAHTRTPLARYLPLALAKLFVHPLLVGAAGLALRALGAPISDLGLTALVLTAALPSASGVSLLAERFGADNGRVARIIMASTALAFVSFSVIAWALVQRLG